MLIMVYQCEAVLPVHTVQMYISSVPHDCILSKQLFKQQTTSFYGLYKEQAPLGAEIIMLR